MSAVASTEGPSQGEPGLGTTLTLSLLPSPPQIFLIAAEQPTS